MVWEPILVFSLVLSQAEQKYNVPLILSPVCLKQLWLHSHHSNFLVTEILSLYSIIFRSYKIFQLVYCTKIRKIKYYVRFPNTCLDTSQTIETLDMKRMCPLRNKILDQWRYLRNYEVPETMKPKKCWYLRYYEWWLVIPQNVNTSEMMVDQKWWYLRNGDKSEMIVAQKQAGTELCQAQLKLASSLKI